VLAPLLSPGRGAEVVAVVVLVLLLGFADEALPLGARVLSLSPMPWASAPGRADNESEVASIATAVSFPQKPLLSLFDMSFLDLEFSASTIYSVLNTGLPIFDFGLLDTDFQFS
jgi:hypothetical protein